MEEEVSTLTRDRITVQYPAPFTRSVPDQHSGCRSRYCVVIDRRGSGVMLESSEPLSTTSRKMESAEGHGVVNLCLSETMGGTRRVAMSQSWRLGHEDEPRA